MNRRGVVIIGAGPAGMMAAGRAAEMGCDVFLLEKMERVGSKLAITGKGRCNITNMEKIDAFIAHYGKNGKFLRNCFARFFNTDLVDFFEARGIPTVVERGRRVFPVSSDADDIVRCLRSYVEDHHGEIRTGCKVESICTEGDRVVAVEVGSEKIPCSAVVIATGGLSYPMTGSTGDGYRFAQDLDHRVRMLGPGLIPIEIKEAFVKEMAGLSLKNVELSASCEGKVFSRLFGEMIFTHFGISGPIVLTMSREIVRKARKGPVRVSINFKPALSMEILEKRLLREFEEHGSKRCKNVLKYLLPEAAVDVFVARSGIPPAKKASEVSREERKILLRLLTDFTMTVKGPRPIAEAIVTEGGVALDEIDPYTMRSKITKGLFFCGEVIDVAGDTGGYNLQAAFSTGYVAGESACAACQQTEQSTPESIRGR